MSDIPCGRLIQIESNRASLRTPGGQCHSSASFMKTNQTEAELEIDLKKSYDALADMHPAIRRFIAENGYPSHSAPRPLSVFSITRTICAQQIGNAQAKAISKRVYDLVAHDIVPTREKTPHKRKRKLDEDNVTLTKEKKENYSGMTANQEEILDLDTLAIAAKILKLDNMLLKSCGLSQKKTDYIVGVAKAVLSGDLVLSDLHKMDDTAVEKELVKLKGIGQWSAHMILLFSLGRKDVWPHGDEAVRSGLRVIFDLKKKDKNTSIKQDAALAEEMGKNFVGHRSALAKLCYFAHGLKFNK